MILGVFAVAFYCCSVFFSSLFFVETDLMVERYIEELEIPRISNHENEG